MINPLDRVTPKFKNSKNFNNILEFLTTYNTDDLGIIADMNNLSSDNSIILDEIGKSLGVYPRWQIPIEILGNSLVFKLDESLLDTVPLGGDETKNRPLSNEEYSRVLRVFARGINFNGTVQEWEDIIFELVNAKCIFSNNASHFGIVVLKELSFIDKKIVEYVLRYNSLTVSLEYIGTTSGGEPFRLDSSQLDDTYFVSPW